MKGSRWFIVFIVAFLFIMFAIEYHLPKNFVWKPTFGHHDEQPFGCAVFDSVLSSSLPQGYTFSRKSLYQLEQEDTTQRRGILVISDNLRLSDVDVNALLKMAERGDKIMLVSTLFGRYLEDTLQFRSYYSYFSPAGFGTWPVCPSLPAAAKEGTMIKEILFSLKFYLYKYDPDCDPER